MDQFTSSTAPPVPGERASRGPLIDRPAAERMLRQARDRTNAARLVYSQLLPINAVVSVDTTMVAIAEALDALARAEQAEYQAFRELMSGDTSEAASG